MNIPEVRKIVGQIQSHLFKRSNAYSVGVLKSHFKGSGLQFKEHRVYEPGDDTRFIDWKLMAKMNDPYVKTFEEERNVEITVVVDLSPTMFYGYNGVSKLQASLEIVCLLYLLAHESKDLIHVILAGHELVDLPKASGEKGIVLFLNQLQKHGVVNSDGKVNYHYLQNSANLEQTEITKRVLKSLARKKEVVLLSDFTDFLSDQELKRVVLSKNSHCFRVLSPLDTSESKSFRLALVDGTTSEKAYALVSGKNPEDQNTLFKKMHDLDVSNRYLEQFIKEMM